MEKANKVLRRSGIRLRSVKSGHSSLKLIISDWKESRNAFKSYISNQETAWSDMVKWASNEPNRALREVLDHILQLQALWTELQTQFLASLKKYQHQFETILESEMLLDKSRTILNSFEIKEQKLNKDLRKASTKCSVDEMKVLEEKLADTKISIQNAQMEVSTNTAENESIKLLLMKEGLTTLSKQYVSFAERTALIFKAQNLIASTLPEATTNVQNITFNGNEICASTLAQLKKDLMTSSALHEQANVPVASDHQVNMRPPPYYSPASASSATCSYYENPPRYCNIPQLTGNLPNSPLIQHDTSLQSNFGLPNSANAVETESASPLHQFSAGQSASASPSLSHNYGNIPNDLNNLHLAS